MILDLSRVGLRLNKTIRETCGVVSVSGLQNIGYLFFKENQLSS